MEGGQRQQLLPCEHLSRLALLCHHPHPCHLLCIVRDLEMGQPPEKGWGIDSGLSGTFAHTRPAPAAHNLVQEDNKPRKMLGALALEPPSPLPSPLHPPPPVHSTPALCSLHYILWLPKPALHPWTFFPNFPTCTKVTTVLWTLVLKMMRPG